MPVYMAMLCVAAAVWLTGGWGRSSRRVRLLLAGGPVMPPGAAGVPFRARELALVVRDGLEKRCGGRWAVLRRAQEYGGLAWWCLPAGALLGLLGSSVLPLLASLAAVPLAVRLLRARERGRDRERRATEVIALCTTVAGELRAGRQPGEALMFAGTDCLGDSGAVVLAAARFGGDVPDALRQAARRPGARGLSGVAACWQVAVDGGAGLASGLERVAAALRAERDQREDLRAELSGARSTAAMLALLPLFGVLMGSALGADPLRVLLHTPAGAACLLIGGLLEWAGLAWTARVVRAAEGPEAGGAEWSGGAEEVADR
ncbi:type II secretion system F family protein [Streptomyces sp. H27-D2]|nr:type II secretion system F family protein [Streptomyces sp. H27-D2]MEC4015001.1 type II secretion system F family protein [Streptomyces sp. H27-D2]